MRVPVGDIELYVHEKGQGRPLVTLHGGPGFDGSIWFPGLDPLAAEGWRILSVDHRANGRSDAGDVERWTVPQMADDVEALIGAPRAHRPGGGRLVVRLLRGPGAHGPSRQRVGIRPARHGLAAGRDGPRGRAARRLPARAPPRAGGDVLGRASRPSRRPSSAGSSGTTRSPSRSLDPEGPLVDVLIEYDEVVFRPEVLRHFATGGTYGMEDWREELSSFDKPVLVLSGVGDRTTDPASAHELAELLPRGEEVVIADAAHMFLYEQPEAHARCAPRVPRPRLTSPADRRPAAGECPLTPSLQSISSNLT